MGELIVIQRLRNYKLAVAVGLLVGAVGGTVVFATSAASANSINQLPVKCSDNLARARVKVGQPSIVIFGPPNSGGQLENFKQAKGTAKVHSYRTPIAKGKSRTLSVVIKSSDYSKTYLTKTYTWKNTCK